MTPPDKSGGFLDNGNDLSVSAHGPHPGPGENVSRRVYIPMKDESTRFAVVHSDRKSFFDFGPASTTDLARASRINFKHLDASAFSLTFQGLQEAAPGGIGDRTGQMRVPNHPADVQALHSNCPVATAKIQ